MHNARGATSICLCQLLAAPVSGPSHLGSVCLSHPAASGEARLSVSLRMGFFDDLFTAGKDDAAKEAAFQAQQEILARRRNPAKSAAYIEDVEGRRRQRVVVQGSRAKPQRCRGQPHLEAREEPHGRQAQIPNTAVGAGAMVPQT